MLCSDCIDRELCHGLDDRFGWPEPLDNPENAGLLSRVSKVSSMVKAAWVFPGQGSQAIGMGLDLATVPWAQERFALAQSVLGWSVLDIVQNADDKVSLIMI